MGGHYGSIHICTEDASLVREAVERLAKEKQLRFLIAPPIGGWTSVFPEGNGQDFEIASALANLLPLPLLHCLVHDDDVFAYQFFHEGALRDQYDSCPDYFGGPPQARGGNAQAFSFLIPDPEKQAKIQDLLDQPRFDFEVGRLERFAQLLALPNAVAAYEYLQDGERNGIKRWKNFIHIPDLAGEKSAKRARNAALKAELKRLTKARVLLFDQSAPKGSYGMPATAVWALPPDDSQFLFSWMNALDLSDSPAHWQALDLFTGAANDPGLQTSKKVYAAKFSRSGKWLALLHASRHWSIEIWDWNAKQKRFEHTFNQHISTFCFSADESRLFAASGQQLLSLPLMGGDRIVLSDSVRQCRTIASHPDGRWLALEWNNMLGLLDLHKPETIMLQGIGGAYDLSQMIPNLYDQAEVDRMLNTAADRLPPEQVENLKRELTIQQQHRYQPKESLTIVDFTPDGKWLVCGTVEGVRVFDFGKLVSDTTVIPVPDFSANADEVSPDPTDKNAISGKYIYALAYDSFAKRILFAGLGGKVKYLDLTSGENGYLLNTMEMTAITQLVLSHDRRLLAMTRFSVASGNSKSSKIQVWDYNKLPATE